MKTLFLSDLHLGFEHCRANDILYVLNNYNYGRLILVGDIIDIHAMKRKFYVDDCHISVLDKIIELSETIEVVWVIGNHDIDLMKVKDYLNRTCNIDFCREYIYTTNSLIRDKVLCIHGDQFENIPKFFYTIGDYAYTFGLWLNRITGKKNGGTSFSKWCKNFVKKEVKTLFGTEANMLTYLADKECRVCVSGHTHIPQIQYKYAHNLVNCGAFVEIATFVSEENGEFTLHDLDKDKTNEIFDGKP